MLGFAPNASLPLADSGVQALLDMGGAESTHAYGTGTISNGARGGGGTYQRIRSVPPLAQRLRVESAVNVHAAGRKGTFVLSNPPLFEAESGKQVRRYGQPTFVVYDPPTVEIEHMSIAETWSHFATSDYEVIGIDLQAEPDRLLSLSVEECVGLSVAPVIEVETEYVN